MEVEVAGTPWSQWWCEQKWRLGGDCWEKAGQDGLVADG